MYMMAFVTLVVALIGLYAEIYTKQAARMFAMQSGVADTMLVWQATAVSLATQLVSSGSITATGCSLTNSTGTLCTASGSGVYVGTTKPSAFSLCNGASDGSAACWTGLPQGYNSAYSFYSLAFQNNGKDYVLTYVPPPPAASDNYNLGLLCLPGTLSGSGCAGQQFTLTFADFYKQLRKNLNASNLSYGTVTSSGVLTTPTVSLGLGVGGAAASLIYTVPPASVIPVNSVAVIAEITPCATTVCP